MLSLIKARVRHVAYLLVMLLLVLAVGWIISPAFVSTQNNPTGSPISGIIPQQNRAGGSVQSIPGSPGGASAVAPSARRLSNGVVVGHDVKHDTSPPLRDIKPLLPTQPRKEEHEYLAPPNIIGQTGRTAVKDPVLQNWFGAPLIPAPIVNFTGLINADNGFTRWWPPDPNGDVGPNHYVQWVNTVFRIFNKSGTSVYGPAAGNTLWSGFGDPCQSHNDGDPVAIYDPIANRWVMTQFTSSSPYGECVAVSQTADPTGAYYRYFFQFSTTVFYDYPKIGVWPDAYYMTANKFDSGNFVGNSAIAFDRTRMLSGLSATFQEFNNNFGGVLPSALDGPTLPPAGSPNYFAAYGIPDALGIWKFHVDWVTPANSTFTGPTFMTTAPFNYDLCPNYREQCISQPSPGELLEALTTGLMHRLAYRNMGSYESLLVNHTVDANGAGQAGVRWYEVRSPNSSPFIYQQGTYAPDSDHRWMGSIAMDHVGNIALGYSVSSSTTNPAVRYTGRLVTDPLNTLPQGEGTFQAGGGVQTGATDRWGDYSNMSVDPADDCTFWYTNEYYPATSNYEWSTRIGSFKFPNCTNATVTPTATSTATFTNTPTRTNTPSVTPTRTNTLTNTPTRTNTPTVTSTASPTSTNTPASLLRGHVTIQGRPAQPSALQSVPITLTLRSTGGGSDYNYTGMSTDVNGNFTVTAPAPGAYNWRTKNPQTLANSGNVVLATGTTNQEMGTLREGDCNNDNCDSAQDFTILRNSFGKSPGDPGYDARADLTGDGPVGSSDFNLIRANYGQCGAGPINLAP